MEVCERVERQECETHHAARLCCPLCGRTRSLHDAEGIPANVVKVICPCPSCEGHETARPVFVLADGAILRTERCT